jgi:hypothetical protein
VSAFAFLPAQLLGALLGAGAVLLLFPARAAVEPESMEAVPLR